MESAMLISGLEELGGGGRINQDTSFKTTVWEHDLKENEYMYMYGWVPSLFI